MQETVLATPPRAWGRLSTLCHPGRGQGNTPTSVGKTLSQQRRSSGTGKHPHERGEDYDERHLLNSILEPPPRAWGRLTLIIVLFDTTRNTPTSVGKTRASPSCGRGGRKHPHERGEDSSGYDDTFSGDETPPRAWGRLLQSSWIVLEMRNTPTSVGKTQSHRVFVLKL